MKLFPKLVLATSLLLIGTIAALSLYFYYAEERQIRDSIQKEQRAILKNLVHMTSESFLTKDDLLLVKYTSWLPKWHPALVSASVVDPSGGVISHSRPERIGQLNIDEGRAQQLVVLTEDVKLGTQWVATASVGFSEQATLALLTEKRAELRRHILHVAGVLLAISVVISFLLALSLTRPIHRLSVLTAQIGEGKWTLDMNGLDKRSDELGALSRAFVAMAIQLRELDQMKEDFVSAVTHELRSPLGAIESYLNLIGHEMKKGVSLDIWQSYVDRIQVNAQRLSRFVNDLLDVASLERGKVILHAQPLKIESVFQDVHHLFEAKLKELHLSIVEENQPALPFIAADPDKLRQVLVNLVSNAIKFSPEGGVIRLKAEKDFSGKTIRISVIDQGIGISPEHQKKIFSKFEQVQAARQKVKGPKGTGLGLAISRALVELHGGTIGVESEFGRGSTFYIRLPIFSASIGTQQEVAV